MQENIVTACEHYDRLIDEIDDPLHPATDPFRDDGELRQWMEQSDGSAFHAALGDMRGKAVLEIGIGTGRVAKKVLDYGCARLTGIDLSAKTVARAQRNLGAYPQVEILQADAETFIRPNAFDVAYCVWTFFHIVDQPRALAQIVASLRCGGRFVLSLERVDEWLDYGSRHLRQFPVTADAVIGWLSELGCTVAPPIEVLDAFARTSEASMHTTIISATRDGSPSYGIRLEQQPPCAF